MNFVDKSFIVPQDFTRRFCMNFLNRINRVESKIYFATLERNIPAQSIIGLLSSGIKCCDIIRINVLNEDLEQAEKDLRFVEMVMLDECENA